MADVGYLVFGEHCNPFLNPARVGQIDRRKEKKRGEGGGVQGQKDTGEQRRSGLQYLPKTSSGYDMAG